MTTKQITRNYNKKLSDKLLNQAMENTDDWYSDEVKKSNMEFLAWLEREVK